ncbi:MAG: TonB-dependent receptor [Cytophagaceae bacterium]|nr:TonB-dependent receptor [Cytophagaceae bacterium]
MRLYFILVIILNFFAADIFSQTYSIKGTIEEVGSRLKISHASVGLKNTNYYTMSNEDGNYELKNIKPGTYTLSVSILGYKAKSQEVVIVDKDLFIDLSLEPEILELDSVVIQAGKEKTFGITRLRDVEGTAIYAGKKSEVVVMEDITANTATNNSRQIYAKVSGLNIWESDGAGIQLGIGGRGLNPNRVSNFNTRQNGYDISADALGYPESYYSPPTEPLDRIEIVRGAASLQYGTQFGGLVNFRLKKGPKDKKIEVVSRGTAGSWGFFNTFNSVGGTLKKFNYYAFYQHKSGRGWRPNSEFNVNTAYTSLSYKFNSRLSLSAEYTFMSYLAHQPGGLTDKGFEENPRQSIRSRNWFRVNWNLGAVILDYRINENLKFNSRFFGIMADRSALGVLSYINRADPMTERDLWIDYFRNFGNESRLLYYYKIKKVESTLLVGFRYYNGFTDRRQGLGNDRSTGTKSDFTFDNPDDLEYSKYTFPNHNTAVFAENIFYLTQKLSIIPGIRFENIQTNASGFYNIVNKDLAGNIIFSQRVDESRKNNRSFVLGGIGLNYWHSNKLQFYANISQNYRSINFNDMRVVNPNIKVDPDLKDEKGYSADVGLRGNLTEIMNYDVSLFIISYNDRIGSVIKSDTITYNIYRLRTNISNSRNLGIETFAELDIWKLIKGDKAKMKLSLFSNLALIDARYINSQEPAYENKKVELVPNILLKSGLTFKKNRFAATYQFSYTSKQYTDASNAEFSSNAVNGIIPSYYVMDLSAEYSFKKYISFTGTINNLANNMYFTRRADGYPGPGIIPSDGRSFYISVQVKL